MPRALLRSQVVYQRILQLSYIDELLDQVKDAFVKLFDTFLRSLLQLCKGDQGALSSTLPGKDGVDLVVPALSSKQRADFAHKLRAEWDALFSTILRSLERSASAADKANRRNLGVGTPLGEKRGMQGANLLRAEHADDGAPDGSGGGGEDPTAAPGTPKGEGSDASEIAKNVAALKARLKAAETSGGAGRRVPSGAGGGAGSGKRGKGLGGGGTPTKNGAGSGTESPGAGKAKKPAKEMRKWDAQGRAILVTEGDDEELDFSFSGKSGGASGKGKGDAGSNGAAGKAEQDNGDLSGWIDERSLGTKKADGTYDVADVDNGPDDDEDDEDEEENAANGKAGAAKSGFLSRFSAVSNGGDAKSAAGSGFFSRFTGTRAITKEDLQPVLTAMQSHLQSKNVATNVAARLCDSVEKGLVGKQLGSFGSVKAEVRKALEDSITRILTPKTSTDILLEIATKRNRQAAALATKAVSAGGKKGAAAADKPDPYSICFVGVNGVGKSTNLAKVCFWLLQNRFKVLIAACDTFRSGAVEQLRVHVRNLGQLEVEGKKVNESQSVELYERGYGKDAAGIAKDALAYAKAEGFDVVLIDTAGRMQDNEPLMRALAKLVAVNQPDKLIFVGEALVGNEAVDQLSKFDKSLKDFSGLANPRGLDGMLLTKFDTIDDKVGTTLTATSVTGLPIYLVGTGQTYTDLRQLRVKHVLNALMRD